jgi:hypothetical protein
MMALHLSGVVFRRKWKPPQLKPWEGPFPEPTQRLPQHPMVAAQKRGEKRRYRLRKEIREREAAQLAAERYAVAGLRSARSSTMILRSSLRR